VERRVILQTDAPTRALASIHRLQLYLPQLVEATMFLLPTSRTMLKGESIMLLRRNAMKLQMLSLV
jgi:hypothetical protein